MRLSLLMILLVALMIGCGPTKPETAIEKEQRLKQFQSQNFPIGATSIQELGNGWYTFELEIDGQNRKFIHHKSTNTYGRRGYGFGAIAELK